MFIFLNMLSCGHGGAVIIMRVCLIKRLKPYIAYESCPRKWEVEQDAGLKVSNP
jgi:hypothetical protein